MTHPTPILARLVLVLALVAPSRGLAAPGQPVQAAASAEATFTDLAALEAAHGAPPRRAPLPSPRRAPPGQRPAGSGPAPSSFAPAATGPAPRAPALASPAASQSFLALTSDPSTPTDGPPDTQGAVGPAHLVTALNTQVRIQDKTGAVVSTVESTTFWSPLGYSDPFDDRILYDPYGGRFIVTASHGSSTPDSALLLAVSTSSDPTAGWKFWAFPVNRSPLPSGTTALWADYPILGFNRTWIAVQVNLYTADAAETYSGTNVWAFDKASAYAGAATLPATVLAASQSSMAPVATYDPSVAALYLVAVIEGSPSLQMASISGALGHETYADLGSPAVTDTWSDDGVGLIDTRGPQLGAPAQIDAGDSRVQNAVYRNGHVWMSHTVWLSELNPTHTAVQWWEIDTATSSVLQRGRINDDTGIFYAYGTIAVNANDDVLIGYNEFASDRFPEARYALRVAGDAAGTLRADVRLKAGVATYLLAPDGSVRWGDLSATVVDTNDVDFWTIQEYAEADDLSSGRDLGRDSDRWGTWWGRVDAPGGSTVTPNPAPTLASISPGAVTAGAAAFTLTASGAGFVPGSLIEVDGAARTTAFVGSTSLTVTIAAADVASATTHAIVVFTPIPGGGSSAPRTLTVTAPSTPPAAAARSGGGGGGGCAFAGGEPDATALLPCWLLTALLLTNQIYRQGAKIAKTRQERSWRRLGALGVLAVTSLNHISRGCPWKSR